MPWTVWKRLAIRLEPGSVWPEASAPSAARSEFENNNRGDVIMWCAYGQQEAGQELFRASCSVDPEVRDLAGGMLAKAISEFKKKSVRQS